VFIDKALAPGTEYCYRVRAVNAAGTSDYTSAACATTPNEALGALYFDGVNDHVILGPASSGSGAGGVLIRNPTNPRYFARAGSDAAIYMTGSHTWNLVQTDDAYLPTYQALEYYLDWVQSFGHNFIRVWANFSYLSYTPVPWNTSGGLALMDSFNQAFFDQLRERVLQITRRGMYCSVSLFGSGVRFKKQSDWETVWWNPDNNSSTVLDSAFSTTDGDTFFTGNTAALNIQKAFAEKVIDTLNDQDLLFWEIINEPNLPASYTWHNAMMAHIRTYESTKPKQHLIMMSGEGADPNSSDESYLFASDADIVSPDNLTPYTITEGGDIAYTAKMVINDSDHVVGWSDPDDADIYRRWVWRAFTRGTHPIFMDSYDDNIPPYNYGSINAAFDPVRAAMGHTKSYADRMDLRYALPSTSFSSTGYALINPGKTYLIYQPGTGSFTYTLPAGDYRYEWFNPNTGRVTQTGAMTGGVKTSTPPGGYTDAVLFISIQEEIQTAPGLGLAAFTIECLFRREGAGATTTTGTGGITSAIPLVTKGREEAEGSSVDMNWFLGIDSNTGRIAADFEDNATGLNHPVFGVTSISNGAWYHAAATYDGTTWRLYLNGSLENQITVNATPRFDSIQHAAIATAMTSTGAAAGFFKGVIDEVRIWSYARTQKEIADSMDKEITSAVGLFGRWSLNEGSGFFAHNSVPGGLGGKLISGPLWVPGYGFVHPGAPPAAPSNPSATAVSASAIDLAWKDNAVDEETFEVKRSTSGDAGPFSPRSVLPAGAETYRDNGLEEESEYCYRVQAVNAAGSSAFTDAVCATTPSAPTYALDFGGSGTNTNTYVTFGNAPGLGLSTFTLECWFRRDAAGTPASTGSGGFSAIPLVTKGRIEADGSSVDMNYFLGIRSSDNVLAADFEDSATGRNHPIVGVTPVANGVWYHAAATYDGSKWQLFLNGRLEAESVAGATPRADSIQHAGLGTALNSTGLAAGYFDGVLDEVRIWNYARTRAEIESDINTEIKTARPGLVARWGLNEGTGPSVKAGAGTTVNGTIVNASYAWVSGAPFNIDLAPAQPVLVAPADKETGVALHPDLTVAVSDPESQALAVNFYGRTQPPGAGFQLIRTAAAVPSGASVSVEWPGLNALADYEWYVTVSDGGQMTTGPIWSFSTTGILGDINGDCDVDGSDLAAFIAAFNSAIGQLNYNAKADIEPVGGDGKVDDTDLFEFAFEFGTLGCL